MKLNVAVMTHHCSRSVFMAGWSYRSISSPCIPKSNPTTEMLSGLLFKSWSRQTRCFLELILNQLKIYRLMK